MSHFIQNSSESFLSIIKVLTNRKPTKCSNNPKGKLLILGNGPSINGVFENDMLLEGIIQNDLICVNYFYKSAYFKKIKPKYYIVAGPEMWTVDVGANYKKERDNMFESLSQNVDWDMTFYIPFAAKKTKFWQEKLSKNKHITIIFYNINAIDGFKKLNHFFFNKKLGMPRSHNIVGYALMLMIWNRYQEIGLLGVEHSWTKSLYVSEENETLLTQPHFYDNKQKYIKMNKDTDEENKRKLHEVIHKFYLSFKSYFEIKDYAEKKNVKILNLTKGSFIDAFDRKDVAEFLF